MKKFKLIALLLCLFIPLAFAGCENKNQQTLSTPNIIEIKGGTIIFDPVADAEYYTLSINDITLNLDVKHSSNVSIIDNKINFDASNIFVVGDSYSVRIMASAAEKISSKYSPAYSYKHNGNISKPTNLKINGTTLTWDAVENASYYVVKIITPNDKILFDKNGEIITKDDPESIASADLTEYTFNTNQFDFSSLLSAAGSYKFYVSAVLSSGANFVTSGYSSKINHTHYITLETPTNGMIKKVGNDLHLTTVIDTNANTISISCNDIEKSAEINGIDTNITFLSDNLLDINLTKYFAFAGVDFDALSQFAFRTQAKHISNDPENIYYLNSQQSDFIYYENTYKLASPTLTIEEDTVNDCYIAKWSCLDAVNVSEYKLFVFKEDEVKEFVLESNITSKLIYGDFVSVAIKAVGVGNFNSSNLSEFVSHPSNNLVIEDLSASLNHSILSWDDVSANYYIVEFENEVLKVAINNFVVDPAKIVDRNYSITISAIKNGHQTKSTKINLNYYAQLATPTIGYGQGFASTNLYELTFTGVDNAIGYYVYLKTKDAAEFEKIDNLYLTTTIDLTKYICSEGAYNDYQVCVQAVADNYSLFVDSELSYPIPVSHIKVLDKPTFNMINDTISPVTKQNLGNSIKYVLKFYGVEDAGSYEILINYNKISINSKNHFDTGIYYEVDISKYLIAANNYEIKVRALPTASAINVQASAFNTANYILTKQLSTVKTVNVTENDGIYSLSFEPVANAAAYRVRIVKEGDSNYVGYLNSLGLSNTIVVNQSLDVTDYVKQKGVYYFYVTALAPQFNSYYADATESATYGYVSKLATLDKPSSATFSNLSKLSYLLGWTGDEHADYYLVKITNPNNISYEFKVFAETSTDINQYMTIEGTYYISLYSMVSAASANAREYTSSAAYEVSIRYNYETLKDFERYSVYMYGEYHNFAIDNANELKHLLWYHYLYEIDQARSLTLMLNLQNREDSSIETVREAILRLAKESNDALVYNFNNDEQWLALVSEPTTSDNSLFTYLCSALLKVYPEFNILENFTSYNDSSARQIFQLNYRNALNVEKQDPSTTTFTNKNYGNEYEYIDLYSRKSPTGLFAIDSRESMFVTTTEQLIHAVQHNKQPNFVGESSLAETVYSNAKLVLSAIVTNNMTDLEKSTAIFDWLQSSYDLTYYTIDKKAYISGSIEFEEVETYGLSKLYYLEGMFESISMSPEGNIILGSNLATSISYSKAFALLCAIEGIETSVINGSYTYHDATSEKDVNVAHSWNKIKLSVNSDPFDKKWFVVDLTFSDNRIYFNDFTKGYGISSHSYFLATDNLVESNLKVHSLTHLISTDYEISRACETSYDYFSNSTFKMTYEQIANTILDFEGANNISGFEYINEYDPLIPYQKYSKTSGYGQLQAFLLNTMIYAKHNADNNSSNNSVFEFKFKWSNNGGSNIFDVATLREIFDTTPNQYSLKIKLIADANNSVYSVDDTENQTTTIIYIVEKTA